MAQINFTDRWLRNVAPKGPQSEFIDASCPNLRVRVGKRSKTFSVMIGDAGSRRRVTLGKYPGLTLAEARHKASATTEDPIAVPVAKKQARFGTVKDLFDFAITAMEAEGKNSEANRIYLRDGPLAAMHHFGEATLARNIRPADITAWLRDIHNAGVKIQHPRAYLSAAFGRGMKADNDPTADIRDVIFGIDANPVIHVGGGGPSAARDRKLSLDELKIVWRDFPKSTSPQTASALRMLIAMGGTRVSEIVCSKKAWWSVGDAPALDIPKTKNATSHSLPLTSKAQEQLIVALANSDPDSPYLYPHRFDLNQPLSLTSVAQAVRRFCDDRD
ncbi:MAG: integrase arm-type DNA-binding domain-containing protein [Parvularculaceae bacterium]